jgi:hypothetical protein
MLIGGYILSLPVHALFKIIPDQRKLLHGTDHRALADACAVVMADYQKYEGKTWDDPALPRVIRNVRPAGIDIAEHGITMEMHGGFDHYGFRFRQDASNTWTLSYYTEHGARPLVTGVVVKSLH